MNKFKKYISRQASRSPMDLTFDLLVVGGFFTCLYFGFIHQGVDMRMIALMAALLFTTACGEEDVETVCETTVTCEDDKEMYCDEPVSTEFNDGTTLELRACTYATYEHCFERTQCKPRG